jgi:hypothetical protein
MNPNVFMPPMTVAVSVLYLMTAMLYEHLLVGAIIAEFMTRSVSTMRDLMTGSSDGLFRQHTVNVRISDVGRNDPIVFVNQYKWLVRGID